MRGSTRRWLAGTMQVNRDTTLARALLHQVRRTARGLRPLLVVTDGWSASPGSMRRAFRTRGQRHHWQRTSLRARVAGPADRNHHHANAEHAGRGDHSSDGSWSAGARRTRA